MILLNLITSLEIRFPSQVTVDVMEVRASTYELVGDPIQPSWGRSVRCDLAKKAHKTERLIRIYQGSVVVNNPLALKHL